jgi:hypothetical protein
MKQRILDNANANLKTLYPDRYTPITFEDIEKVYARNVLGIQADAKTRKGTGKGYLTGIMYFAPAKLSGIEVCPARSAGCAAACLFSAGRGRFYTITRARMIKTLAYHFDKARFIATVKKSIASLLVKAKNKGLTPVVRLNGTSDILWERTTDIIQSFPKLRFYDYTKIAKRFLFDMPKNYHLTFSLSESNETDARFVLAKGGNVAAVFRGALPKEYLGYQVINGDETDLRFLDKRNSIVGLKAKGKAKKDTSGFVKDYGEVPKNAVAS